MSEESKIEQDTETTIVPPTKKTPPSRKNLPLIIGGAGCALLLCLVLIVGIGLVTFNVVKRTDNLSFTEDTPTGIVIAEETPEEVTEEAIEVEPTATATPTTEATETPEAEEEALPEEETPVEPGEPEIASLVFATETTDDYMPVDPADVFDEGITEIHAVFEYANLYPDDVWERVWTLDGEEVLRLADPWEGDESGVFDYFLDGEGDPLPAGEWALEIYVNDMLLADGTFTIEGAKDVIGKNNTPTPTPQAEATPTPTDTPAPVSGGLYQLVYSKWDGQYHNIYTADTNGRNERFLISRAAGPSWSANGKRLFFYGEEGINQQVREGTIGCELNGISNGIVSMTVWQAATNVCGIKSGPWFCEQKGADGQGPDRNICAESGITFLQNQDWKQGSARWTMVSPNDSIVAFDAKPGSDFRIYFRDIRTFQSIPFELIGEQASWSPDSQKLVYRSGRDNKTGIWISNRDDSGHVRLTDSGSDSFPTWSPDGRSIAFSREEGGNVDIYAINVDGSNLRRLTTAPGQDTLPLFTPGGDIIFRSARSGSWGIWKMSGSGDKQIEIIPKAGVGPDWAFSKMDVR